MKNKIINQLNQAQEVVNKNLFCENKVIVSIAIQDAINFLETKFIEVVE